jgi:hypothetical protein
MIAKLNQVLRLRGDDQVLGRTPVFSFVWLHGHFVGRDLLVRKSPAKSGSL